MTKRNRWLGVFLALTVWMIGGCGRQHAPEPPRRLEVNVFADTGRTERLHIVPPAPGAPVAATRGTAVWLARVAPARWVPIEAPLPEVPPGTVDDSLPAPPGLEVDPDLKPPLLRFPGTLRLARGRGFVELDVRVGEDGTVTDALWAGGSRDSALAAAATECALGMRFYPALRAGRPVAVWCRQRFDFAGGDPNVRP
jgi:TonB family protein